MLDVRPLKGNLLLKALRNGDETAWRQLLSQYRAALFLRAYDLLNDSQEAEDVVQELFIRLWEKRASLKTDQEMDLEGYLFSAIRNRCLDRLDSREVYKKHIHQFSYINKDTGTSPNAEDHREILSHRLSIALGELKGDPAFHAFELMHLQHKNYWQTAEQLGLNPGTVRNQVSKVLKKLRLRLNTPK